MIDVKARFGHLVEGWKKQDALTRYAQGGVIGAAILSILTAIFSEPSKYGVDPHQSYTVMAILGGFVSGVITVGVILLVKHLFTRYGRIVLLIALGLLILVGDVLSKSPFVITAASGTGGIAGFIAGVGLMLYLFLKITPKTKLPNVFGNSRWATEVDLADWELLGDRRKSSGLFLGVLRQEHKIRDEDMDRNAIIYDGDMHALTVAPTRRGKGATAIIPNLLRSDSSILVIDPKGENARRTVDKRLEFGQAVRVIDPWGISCEADKYGPGIEAKHLAKFNPLDALDPKDPDLTTDAMLLADALVIPSGNDPFWGDEAKALIHGFILYVVTDPREKDHRTLCRVRDILCLPPAKGDDPAGTLEEILLRMTTSEHPLVAAAAARLRQKADKERAGVISTAQSNTHFLDSPKIRESLSGSDFKFADLKTADKGVTVYLVLPLDRLPSFNRWLRLLISSAMIDLTRIPAAQDRPPVRVILDEFAALEKLSLIETAFGTMAGLGVQLWVVTQDLTQLMRLYGEKSWQTFVSNAGVFQYFGSRDYETAKYAEHLTGMTTLKKRSISFGKTWGDGPGGSSSGGSETTSVDDVSRPLAYADEMMTLDKDEQVLFIENRYPIRALKWWWFDHQEKTQDKKKAA